MNSRAGYPTYTLSRGASSPLEYFRIGDDQKDLFYFFASGVIKKMAEGKGFEPLWAFTQTVFKTASL